MPKLITPVQYEPALEELNTVRPMHLQERTRRTLDVSVVNGLPIESVKSTAGTLAKCTQQGALLNNKAIQITGLEVIPYDFNDIETIETITFSQPVKEVLVNVTYIADVTLFNWCTDNYLVTIKNLLSLGNHWLSLRGITFDVYIHVLEIGYLYFNVYGFY